MADAPSAGSQAQELIIVLKGYPRVSETFIAQEIFGLQNAGFDIRIVSLRAPYDAFHHPIHEKITAPVLYLPEHLRAEPRRVLAALLRALRRGGFWRALGPFLRDLARDPGATRLRSFGQALVLAAEMPDAVGRIHAHFAHTPASVARYGAILLGLPLSISAHAKDIWTSPDWELREKLEAADWTVTCTASGQAHLRSLAPRAAVHLVYHGLDLERFPAPDAADACACGGVAPVRILSVGRAVPKKGFDTILTALSRLPPDLNWVFDHAGGGAELEALKAQAERLGLADRIRWHGPRDQTEILDLYRRSDIFVMGSRAHSDGDRDGLPNVLVEAASQGLACVGTRFAAIPEFLADDETGLLVPPNAPDEMARAIARLIRDPDLRHRLGRQASAHVRRDFDSRPGIERLSALLRAPGGQTR